jgi:hypothetical protein
VASQAQDLTPKAKTFLDAASAGQCDGRGVQDVDGAQIGVAGQGDHRGAPVDWWRGASLYEVYVRSFMDHDGDGEGDLAGLMSRLDYLSDLGVEALWLTPVFPSPMFDSGYDVADYRRSTRGSGRWSDFRALVEAAHARGLRIVLDQVYSHSSHLHPWFIESASSRDNPKADWYVWADARPRWRAAEQLAGPVRRVRLGMVATRRQYYLHNFLIEQPDLNLHNPRCRTKFWTSCGSGSTWGSMACGWMSRISSCTTRRCATTRPPAQRGSGQSLLRAGPCPRPVAPREPAVSGTHARCGRCRGRPHASGRDRL